MIRGYIPGLRDDDVSEKTPRDGDCTILKDDLGTAMIIDGYCGAPARRLVDYLKSVGIRKPYLDLTHPHYDHYNGIELIIDDDYFFPRALSCPDPASYNRNFSRDCAQNVAALERIIGKAKKKNIPVCFLEDGMTVTRGDIDFAVYRNQPETAENTDSYLNDGSLCFYFPKLRYLTTGDAGFECANRHGLRPVFIKGGHHGNRIDGLDMKPSKMAKWLYDQGCRYYWDNDYSTGLNDFLMTGRDDAITAGMEILDIHGDINFVAFGGKMVIYKGGKHWSYKCDYHGGTLLRNADLGVVKEVLKGVYGKGDARVTNLIEKGYRPANVQQNVNEIFHLLRG